MCLSQMTKYKKEGKRLLFWKESSFAAGILYWRDYINSFGGICVGGSFDSDSKCNNGNR